MRRLKLLLQERGVPIKGFNLTRPHVDGVLVQKVRAYLENEPNPLEVTVPIKAKRPFAAVIKLERGVQKLVVIGNDPGTKWVVTHPTKGLFDELKENGFEVYP